MPSLDSNDLDIIRTFPQSVFRQFSIAEREVVFVGQVNGSPTLDPVSGGVVSFAYDNSTGSVGAVERDFTIEFGTTAGAKDIGVSRLRRTISGGIISIAETSLGALPIENNHHFTIYEEVRPWLRLPRLVGIKNSSNLTTGFTEYHDYDRAYTDQNEDIPPIVNISRSATSRISPVPAGWTDPGQVYRTVSLSAFFSRPGANGASLSTYSWLVGDCTITVGTSTSQTITLQAPIGFRYIKLTVTDSNGTSQHMRFPIWTHDNDTYPPYTNFNVTTDQRGLGRVMGFEFFGEDDSFAIYEGQLICYWEVATNPPYDMPDDYIPAFTGFATRDSEEIKLYDRSVYRLEVGGTQYWLNEFNGFAQKLKEVQPAGIVNRWYKFPFGTLTVDRVTHYILREYTNILNIANFHWSDTAYQVKAEEWKKASIWAQIVELQAGNVQHQVVCDSMGAIWIRPKYEYLDLADRVDVDIVINLDKQDWTDEQGLGVSHDYIDKVSIVSASGSKVNQSTHKNVLLFAKAPGLVPSQAGNDEEMPFQRLPPTAAISKLCKLVGHHYAASNNPRGEVSLELIGNYDFVEIAWGEPVTITWSEDSIRGTVVNSEEFIITGISVAHSNEKGVPPKTITWTLKQATLGEPGIQYFPPVSDGEVAMPSIKFPKINIPEYKPAEWISLPPSVPGIGLVTVGWSAPWFQEEYLMITRNGNTNDPTYEQINLALNGGTIAFAADPWSPLYLNAGTQVNSWAATHEHIYRILDIFGARTKSIQYNFGADTPPIDPLPFHTTMVTQPCSVGFCAFAAYCDGTDPEGIYVFYTINGGTLWNRVEIPTVDPSFTEPVKLWASPFIDGKLYLCYVDNTEVIANRLWRSLDFGATWEDLTDLALVPADFAGMFALPYSANPNSDTIIYQVSQEQVKRYNIANEIFTSINLPDHAVIQTIIDIAVSPLNPNRMVVIMSGSGVSTVYVSRNAGVTWTQTTGYGTSPRRIVMNAKNVNSFYLMGEDDNIDFVNPVADVQYTRDYGVSYESKTGNLLSFDDPTPLYLIGWAGTL